jgi:Ser-tRNA(Ala) deacylase AlaX
MYIFLRKKSVLSAKDMYIYIYLRISRYIDVQVFDRVPTNGNHIHSLQFIGDIYIYIYIYIYFVDF